MGWVDSPQYLKGIQKIKAMSPDQKAVTQTLIDELSSLYADADMQKQLQSMRIAADVKRMDRESDLAERRFKANTALRQEELDLRKSAQKYERGETSHAENLGWANIGLAGLSGYGDMARKKKQASFYDSLLKKAYGSK